MTYNNRTIANASVYCPANKSHGDCARYKHCKWTGLNCVNDTDYIKQRAAQGKPVYSYAGGTEKKRKTGTSSRSKSRSGRKATRTKASAPQKK
jgi:hypothetical protein